MGQQQGAIFLELVVVVVVLCLFLDTGLLVVSLSPLPLLRQLRRRLGPIFTIVGKVRMFDYLEPSKQ